MIEEEKKINGLTTFCRKKYLDGFLQVGNEKTAKKQPFELYEGPPEFLPMYSPIFIFEAGREHKLRAIARFIGYKEIDGWKKRGEEVASILLDYYEQNDIVSHDTQEELIEFCSKKDGVRGLFVFDRIIEIKYKTEKDWIRKKDFLILFKGKQPYAQGYPYRYLSGEMVSKLINLLQNKASNYQKIVEFIERMNQ